MADITAYGFSEATVVDTAGEGTQNVPGSISSDVDPTEDVSDRGAERDDGIVTAPPSDIDTLERDAYKPASIYHPDRTIGYKTPLGKGSCGGEMTEGRGSRSTLIQLQPGVPRTQDGYVPMMPPKTGPAPGDVLFAVDIPGIHQGFTATRVVINNNSGSKGAQFSLEQYMSGKSVRGMKDGQSCNEKIVVTSFNVSEIQMVKIELETMSTFSLILEQKREEERRRNGDPNYHACCCSECCDPFCALRCCYMPNIRQWLISNCTPCCCTREDVIISETVVHTDHDLEPHDMINISRVSFVMRSGIKDSFRFEWATSNVGKEECDIQYSIAEHLKGPCQDTSSTARTIANIIHFCNAASQ